MPAVTPRTFTTTDLPTFGDQIELDDGTVLVVNEITRSEKPAERLQEDIPLFPTDRERHIMVWTFRALEPCPTKEEIEERRERARNSKDGALD